MRESLQQDVYLETLDNHAALVARLIRSKPILKIYFRWLSRPAAKIEPPQAPAAPVKAALDSLLNPLRNDSDRSIQRETESTSSWIGAICEYITLRSQSTSGGYLIRSLAAGLLPLYRTLATGRLQEGLTQTRHRLGETLALIGLVETLQLEQMLELAVGPQTSPCKVVMEQLKINPTILDYLISQVLEGYNPAKDDFDTKATNRLIEFRAGDKLPISHQTPEWSNPQLLWGLSNELVSIRSELVLPRSWIDTPVPWSTISEHWHELEQLLTLPFKASARNHQPANSKVVANQTGIVPAKSPRRADSQDGKAESQLVESASTMALDRAAAIVQAAQAGWDNLTAMDVIDQALDKGLNRESSTVVVKTDHARTTDKASVSAVKHEAAIIPKVLIGEITNHNDPAFANVIRRQIGVCKQEDRSICLSMIMVTALDQRESQSLSSPSENGLNRWQQKLVNWMCDHPEINRPAAFITRDGQLLLVVMDTERNAMTRVLRQGLVETLTGKSEPSSDLSRVPIPANFHVGMSSICSPGSSFEFEELIASAHRCLSAAERMGSASIKSIEVY